MKLVKYIMAVWCFCTATAQLTSAATHYVDLASPSPTPPYTSWATAATNIQDAVDAAVSGDTVVVTNGHYLVSSLIVATNDITIESVNGPEATIVDGHGAVRCFNLGNAACIISGLTVTNGYSSGEGGGIYCTGPTPVVTNCTIIGNSAEYGGGMAYGRASDCSFSSNTVVNDGGGMYGGTANNCRISGNSANNWGGGTYMCTTRNCTISGNSARDGGGMAEGTAENCIIYGNSAANEGGGVFGLFEGETRNCTIIENSASTGGGVYGIYGGSTYNGIVWYNNAPVGPNLSPTQGKYYVVARNCCSPDVTHGVSGNITNAPLLLSTSHVAPDSPCRGAGSSEYAVGTDIDGESWLDPPSIGCDEYHGTVGGWIKVAIDCATHVVEGYRMPINGMVEGAVLQLVWDFDGGTFATNSLYPAHAWDNPGTYSIVLTAYNDSYPSGVSATQTVEVASRDDTIVYVAMDGDDSYDGTSWATAKATIQAGVDVQLHAGGLVWVGSGTYSVSSEIEVEKGIVIQSADGPETTIVDGQGISRCFNLGNQDCTISGLTITNGYAAEGGGGIYCSGQKPYVTNCVIIGNNANSQGGGIHAGIADHCTISGNAGGGMYGGTANHCVISGNTSSGMSGGTANFCTISGNAGGGMYGGTANFCTIIGNPGSGMSGGTANFCTISANSGGGMDEGIANNCVIIGNSANNGGGLSGYYIGTANNCLIVGNSATYGGGMAWVTANNCTIVYNTATDSGGGMFSGAADNCIVWYNQAPSNENLDTGNVLYSCSPDLTHGVDGNITNAPMFVDDVGLNYRLLAESPCLNAGLNSLVAGFADLDGNSRISGPIVDMGAYEYIYDYYGDEDGDGMNNGWEFEYFGSIVNANPNDDSDYDSYDNLSECIAGTDPFDAVSILKCALKNENPLSGHIIEWSSVPGRWYEVLWASNLTNSFESLQDFIEYPQHSYTDTTHNAESIGFYDIEVRLKP